MSSFDMETPPIMEQRRVCRVDPPMWELHWRKLRKTLVYENDAQWSHWSMEMQWRGTSRGNGMLGDQRSQQLIDTTSGFRVMSSCKSHENVVQRHLVIFCPRAKNQMEKQNCMLLAPTSLYGKCRYGNTTNNSTVEGFVELTHQCKSSIEGN